MSLLELQGRLRSCMYRGRKPYDSNHEGGMAMIILGLVQLLLIAFMCECAVSHQWLTMAGIWVMLMFTVVLNLMFKESDK